MADLSDVENALVGVIAGALFPGTSYVPGNYVTSATGTTIKLMRGWPVANQLDADVAAGKAQVTVFSEPGMTRNTTRWEEVWRPSTGATPTLTATVSGASVTYGGTGGSGQVAGLQIGAGESPSTYAYRLLSTDTPATVAAAMAALISGATASGAVLTLPANTVVQAAVAVDTASFLEVRRQEQGVRVMCWCPSPATRDAIVTLIDLALAQDHFIPLADGTSAYLRYRSTYTDDVPSKDRLWRRDLCYMAEYGTTLLQQQPTVLFPYVTASLNSNTDIIGPH